MDKEYAAGRVGVDNMTTDDLRLAHALELLLGTLSACSFLVEEAPGADAAAASADIAR